MDPNGRISDHSSPERRDLLERLQRVQKEINNLTPALKAARRVKNETGRYADQRWYQRSEAELARLQQARDSLHQQIRDLNDRERAAKTDVLGRLHTALCDVITERFGNAALHTLIAEAYARLERAKATEPAEGRVAS